jgi:hypothetical protein
MRFLNFLLQSHHSRTIDRANCPKAICLLEFQPCSPSSIFGSESQTLGNSYEKQTDSDFSFRH